MNQRGTTAAYVQEKPYNHKGNLRSTKDAPGNETIYLCDNRGFLEKKIDANGGVQWYVRDLIGRLIAGMNPKNYDSSKSLDRMNQCKYAIITVGS